MGPENATFEGQSELSTLALNKLRKVISDREAKANDIARAILPLKTIAWTLPIIRIVGSKPLKSTLRLLRIATLPSKKYTTYAKTITGGIYSMEQELPDGWHLWLICLDKFDVADLLPLRKIRAIAN